MSRLRRNVIANYFGGAWAALMGIAFVPFYIDYLGIEAYGLIGLYVALQAWMVILDMGFTPSLNREMARLDSGQRSPHSARCLLRSLEYVYLPLGVGSALVIFTLSPWIADSWLDYEKLGAREVAAALSIMGITVVARWFSTLYRGALLGLQYQVWLNVVTALFATVRGGGVLLVLEFGPNTVFAFFLFQFMAFASESLVLRGKLLRLLPPADNVGFRAAELSGVARFALGVAFINILAGLLTQLDKFVLSAAVSLETLGQYTLASTVAGALFIAVAPVSNAAFPRFTESWSRSDSSTLAREYRDLTQLMSSVIVPVGLLLAVFAYPVLALWTGNRDLAAASAPLLTILALGSMLNGLMTLPYVLQLASGWTRLTLTLNLAAVLAYVPVVYPAIERHGAVAPAVFWLGLNLFYVLASIPLMHRRLLPDERSIWYAQSLLAPLLACGLVCYAGHMLLGNLAVDRSIGYLFALGMTAAATISAGILATPVGRRLVLGFLRPAMADTRGEAR